MEAQRGKIIIAMFAYLFGSSRRPLPSVSDAQISSIEPGRLRTIAQITLAILSIAAFSVAVSSLHQEKYVRWPVEETGPLSVGVSQRLVGAPLGWIDQGIYVFFVRDTAPNVNDAVHEALSGAKPNGVAMPDPDGVGVGTLSAGAIAFALFGLRPYALPLFFILLIAGSAIAFILRFRDERLLIVPIVMCGMTLFLFLEPVSLSFPDGAAQMPIGGERSYAIVPIIAGLHWLLQFVERPSRPIRPGELALLCGQATVLGFAILVRGAPSYLMLPIIAAALLALRRRDETRGWQRVLARLSTPLAVVVLIVAVLPPILFPRFAATGRLHPVVWHRLLVSFSVNPEWPFPDMAEQYQCPYGDPRGSTIADFVGDAVGNCAWISYAIQHGMSPEVAGAKIFDGDYERALRGIVFDIVRSYPRQAFETFFYWKPLVTLRSLKRGLWMHWPGDEIVGLALAQAVFLIAFVVARPPLRPLRDAIGFAGILCLLLAFGLIPQLIAHTHFSTEADLLVYLCCFPPLALAFVVAYPARWIAATFRPARRSPGAGA